MQHGMAAIDELEHEDHCLAVKRDLMRATT